MVGGYGAGAPDGEGGAGGTEGDILVPLPLPADKSSFWGTARAGIREAPLIQMHSWVSPVLQGRG